MRGKNEAAFDLHRAKQALVDRDYQEVITYSFVSPEMQQLIDPGLTGVQLANPISAEMSVMRTSLWPGLLQAARYNQSRQQERIRIFESGLRFRDEAGVLNQQPMLAGLITGSRHARAVARQTAGRGFLRSEGGSAGRARADRRGCCVQLSVRRSIRRCIPARQPA